MSLALIDETARRKCTAQNEDTKKPARSGLFDN